MTPERDSRKCAKSERSSGSLPESGPLGASYWDRVSTRLRGPAHYMDAFMGELKVQAYLSLLERWGWPADGPQLKTDLFEEATDVDPLLWHMPAAGLRVGMDLSPQAAVLATGHDPAGSVACVAADSRALPFAEASFAGILSPSTLDHFASGEDLGVSLKELWRVLAPGGVLVITLANRSNIGDPLLRLAIRLGLSPYYIGQRYTARELRDELTRAGFRIVDQTAIIHHPRLMAALFVRIGRLLPWRPIVRAMQAVLRTLQRLEKSRYKYATGCFVAALAVKPEEEA
jgi:SAM-dependent methyltransferase